MVGNHNHVALISLYILLKNGFIAVITPFRCPRKHFEPISQGWAGLEVLIKFFSMLCCFGVISA